MDEANGVVERLRELEKFRRDTELKEAARVEREKDMVRDIHDLKVGFDGLRRAIITFCFTIAATGIGLAITVLSASGKI